MSVSAPMIEDPTNLLLTALPFVSPCAGIRCHNVISRTVNAPEARESDDEKVQVIMLHLRTKNGLVLLEMVSKVVGAGLERCVVLTGREVSTSLAGLISSEISSDLGR